jgi:asparagine synthase (glutamine-hydrolysing)
MCGFLVSADHGDNSRIRLRGPDLTRTISAGGLTFVHNLLSITGRFTPQPFVDGDVVCLYNGQIYNQPFQHTDGEVLIPLYRQHGPAFARELEGEFAIALYDFAKEIVVFATDPFKTKPLFVNGIECASYRSGVGGEKAAPNQIVVKHLDGRLLDTMEVRHWDLRQQNDTYDRWIAAFERAVARRAKPHCFLGLSSGYDSGAIACSLLRSGVDFKAYVFKEPEDGDVIRRRCALVPHQEFTPDFGLLPWLQDRIDNEKYTILVDGQEVSTRILDDGASVGMATIARLASTEGRRVALSGQGADELMSDYSPWPAQSELKGTFPSVLRLWNNFNFGCQESYLMKEEYVSGAFGIETRYPFLDPDVVQEFLSLSAPAKNRYYKAPIRAYLMRHDFPFEEGAKRGFRVILPTAGR